MQIIKFIRILSIFLLIINFSILKADTKKNIISNINNSESLKFDFIQISDGKEETGICYLKRPHYLKCQYNDKNQKELIVNKNKLVIHQKRYKKIYRYPLSKSFFSEILDRQRFSEMISKGKINKVDDNFLVNCFLKEKGEIIFYFNSTNFNLEGWNLISLNNKKIIFQVLNSVNNLEIKNSFFDIPKIN